MHEMGVVFNVVKTIESYAIENNIPEIHGVVMEIGEVSSVIPRYFASCWEPAIASSKCLMNAQLQIEIIPGIARCLKCGEEFNIEKGEGKCEKCGSLVLNLVSNPCSVGRFPENHGRNMIAFNQEAQNGMKRAGNAFSDGNQQK